MRYESVLRILGLCFAIQVEIKQMGNLYLNSYFINFDLFHFVSIRFEFRFDLFRFVPFRFCYFLHFILPVSVNKKLILPNYTYCLYC